MILENIEFIRSQDPEIGDAVAKEYARQQRGLELIASENVISPAVMATMGTVLANKYAEGYPGKRYYGGCECVDIAENIAIERAKKLFGAEHANVQPHSGAQANTAVYLALLKPGDTVLGMNLAHGGHLTHGSPVNISGMLYNFIPYGVDDETSMIDYDKIEAIAKEHKPKLIVAGASAYPRIIDSVTGFQDRILCQQYANADADGKLWNGFSKWDLPCTRIQYNLVFTKLHILRV